MNKEKSSNRLKGKDLITIGIFSAVYFVINLAFMLAGGIHPMMWILLPAFIALFAGIPYMLMAVKVQKPGAVFLMGLITGLIYFVTGQFTVIILISFGLACALSELIRYMFSYKTFLGNALAYIFFSLGMVGSPLPIWIFRKSFIEQISSQGMPADYISTLEALSSNNMLVVLFIAPVIGGIIGAVIAKVFFKKHFEKAGIV
jgi:energy-coupling factor transport system substrate-specific component